MQDSLSDVIEAVKQKVESEKLLEIMYRPQALFRVKAVTRCSSSMPGTTKRDLFSIIILFLIPHRAF